MRNHELRITNYELPLAKIIFVFCLISVLTLFANAQSTSQNSPTPIISNEIGGRIAARDLGDARLTTYYYTFDGNQGDVFINVVTTNFNGDIDVFTADNLRPLTKITAYADSPNNETGRVVYLRQPLKLILRIEGRTPNDDAATFQIKFAGSFAPSTAIAENSNAPEVKSNNETDVRVNSVGTIIEIKPKPTPTPKITVVKVEKPPKEKKPKTVAETKQKVGKTSPVVEKADAEKVTPETTVAETETKENVVKEPIAEPEPVKEEKPAEPQSPPQTTDEKVAVKEPEAVEKKPEIDVKKETPPVVTKEAEKPADDKDKTKEPKKKSNAVKSVPPSELASINLIILFKDGSKIERPMSEVLKVGVDKGILTVISKDGAIGRYSILDVEKMTIQ